MEDIDIIEKLGGRSDFGERFSVYVPSKDRNDNPIDTDFWRQEALSILATLGQGATIMPEMQGLWLGPKGEEVFEDVVVVYTFIIPETFLARIDQLREFLHRMGRETNQGAVACEFDGCFFTIETFDER